MYFQQLRRELDRCKRRDQLPAGCVHKQLFHHLRNRLSEFGRRKCGQLQRDRVKSEDDYRVRAYNGCATSANSSVKSVKTSCTPVAPTAQSATNVTASSFTANWSSVSGATDYRLDVSTSYKQLFHHLRSRLSEFGRWKCDQLARNWVKCEHDLLLPSASLQWVCYELQFQRHNCTDELRLSSCSRFSAWFGGAARARMDCFHSSRQAAPVEHDFPGVAGFHQLDGFFELCIGEAVSDDRRDIEAALDHRRHLVPGFIHLAAVDSFDCERAEDHGVPINRSRAGHDAE